MLERRATHLGQLFTRRVRFLALHHLLRFNVTSFGGASNGIKRRVRNEQQTQLALWARVLHQRIEILVIELRAWPTPAARAFVRSLFPVAEIFAANRHASSFR